MVFLILYFFFISCLSMLCNIVANFGTHPLLIHFPAAVSALCWLSEFCTLKKKIRNRLRVYSKIRQFDTYQIALLMRNQGQKSVLWKRRWIFNFITYFIKIFNSLWDCLLWPVQVWTCPFIVNLLNSWYLCTCAVC